MSYGKILIMSMFTLALLATLNFGVEDGMVTCIVVVTVTLTTQQQWVPQHLSHLRI